jgi:hypothetical protein
VSANLIIDLEACMATLSWVNRDYRRGLSTHLCGAPVLRISKVELSKTQLLGAGFRPRAPSVMMSLEGTMVLKAEL